MYTGFAVLILVVLTCCFFVVVVILRGLFGPQRQQHRGPVPTNRSEVSFTTLDSVLADAELMPDIVNERASPVDMSLPDVLEEPGGGTTDVVFVVMPDSTMHLGQGEDVSPRAVDTPAVSAALKPSVGSTAGGSSGPPAAAGESASESGHVYSIHARTEADSSGEGAVVNPAQAGHNAGRDVPVPSSSASASLEAVGASAIEQCSIRASREATQGAVELAQVGQQASRGDEGVSSRVGRVAAAVSPVSDVNAEAAVACTSAACFLPSETCHHDSSSSFHTGEGMAESGIPVSQCEQGID